MHRSAPKWSPCFEPSPLAANDLMAGPTHLISTCGCSCLERLRVLDVSNDWNVNVDARPLARGSEYRDLAA
jgi:hypothetical protein